MPFQRLLVIIWKTKRANFYNLELLNKKKQKNILFLLDISNKVKKVIEVYFFFAQKATKKNNLPLNMDSIEIGNC